MDRACFDKVFDSEIIQPLQEVGFVSAGKSLHLVRNHAHVALIRLGGRSSIPGSISSALCFRHSFLRLVGLESDAGALKFSVFDFPYKLTFKEGMGWSWKLRYESRLLSCPHDRLDYSNLAEMKVLAHLKEERKFLVEAFLPAVLTKHPKEIRDEIVRFGTNGWCEKMWVEDYDLHLARIGGST
jgi:hypothetical protein